MSKVAEILRRRDGVSVEEAERQVSEVREAILNCNGSYTEAEEIMLNELGLEMDYIFDILY